MKKILSIILIAVLSLPVFSFVGCKSANNEQETGVIRVCNCEEYIDEDLLDEFTEATGIEVIYSTFGTNENLYNELVINPNSYDLVVPSEYMIEKLAEEGRLNKLDLDRVPNYKNGVSSYIDSRLKDMKFTVKAGEYKGEEVALSDFMVGYMWGTMGWVYNTENVDENLVKSWAGVFDDASLNKKVTIKDAVRDSYLVGLAMVYGDELKNAQTNEEITEILNRTNQVDIDKVGNKINEIKPMLYGFEVDSGKNDIVLGNIDAYVAWSGDAAYAIDVAAGLVEDDDGTFVQNTRALSYYVPDEGSNIWFDGFVMPSGSKNYDVVYEFLNFISSPSSVYRNMNSVCYTSMVANGELEVEVENEDGSIDTVNGTLFDEVVVGWFDESEDLAAGEGVEVDFSYFFGNDAEYKVRVSEENLGRLISQYPTLEIISRCAIMNNFSSEILMSINDMWESVKGETFPMWLIILFIVLVVLLAIVVVLLRNKEKLPWLRLPSRKTTYSERTGHKIIKKEYL